MSDIARLAIEMKGWNTHINTIKSISALNSFTEVSNLQRTINKMLDFGPQYHEHLLAKPVKSLFHDHFFLQAFIASRKSDTIADLISRMAEKEDKLTSTINRLLQDTHAMTAPVRKLADWAAFSRTSLKI